MIITFEKSIPDSLKQIAESEQIKYETLKGVECNYTPFYFVATEQDGVAGLISGYTCYAEVYIDDIVVFSQYRNRGIGKKLIQSVEEHFFDSSFTNMNLVTSEFQAPEFYKKCGFALEFIRHNRQNPMLTKYFFVKFFDH